MKVSVNPFEPWRPAEAHIPPPLHIGRPWRPPPPPRRVAAEKAPTAKPVNPPPQCKKAAKQLLRKKLSQSRMWDPSFGSIAVVFAIALLFLCVLALLGIGSKEPHLPQVATLAASGAILCCIALNQRRRWQTRLTGLATALALAGMAAWVVPTLRGVNQWSAYRQVEALRALPAGDVAEYQRGSAARHIVVQDFPSLAWEMSAAEKAWLRRTVDEAVEKADRQLEDDPHAAFVELHRLNAELSKLEFVSEKVYYASVHQDLEAARQRALQACRKVVQRR